MKKLVTVQITVVTEYECANDFNLKDFIGIPLHSELPNELAFIPSFTCIELMRQHGRKKFVITDVQDV